MPELVPLPTITVNDEPLKTVPADLLTGDCRRLAHMYNLLTGVESSLTGDPQWYRDFVGTKYASGPIHEGDIVAFVFGGLVLCKHRIGEPNPMRAPSYFVAAGTKARP
jgi:hypothetical protein